MSLKFAVACAVLILFTELLQASADQNDYTTKYDNIDLDQILANDRLLNGYIRCLLNEGPCSPDGKELKNNLPDAVNSDCSKCSEKQREGSLKVTHYIIDNKPDEWELLEKMYNPSGEYRMKYLESKDKEDSSEN